MPKPILNIETCSSVAEPSLFWLKLLRKSGSDSTVQVPDELTKLCQFISMKIEKNNVMPENTPHSIAAGVVYFISQICKLNISKKDVKNVSEISEVTINKCFKKLEKIQEELLPAVIMKKYAVL